MFARANLQTLLTQWPAPDRALCCFTYGAGFLWTLLLCAVMRAIFVFPLQKVIP